MVRTDWFQYAAVNYKFKDDSFEALCEHNAQVALNFKNIDTYKNWMIIKTIFTDNYSTDYRYYNNNNNNKTSNLLSTNKENSVILQIPHTTSSTIGNVTSNLDVISITTSDSSTPLSTSPMSLSSSSSSLSSDIAIHQEIYNSSRMRNLSGDNSIDELIVNYPEVGDNNENIVHSKHHRHRHHRHNHHHNTNLVNTHHHRPSHHRKNENNHHTNKMINYNFGNSQDDDSYFNNNINKEIVNGINNQQQLHQLFTNMQMTSQYDEENSMLPNDIIEYNDDDIGDVYFLNERRPSGGGGSGGINQTDQTSNLNSHSKLINAFENINAIFTSKNVVGGDLGLTSPNQHLPQVTGPQTQSTGLNQAQLTQQQSTIIIEPLPTIQSSTTNTNTTSNLKLLTQNNVNTSTAMSFLSSNTTNTETVINNETKTNETDKYVPSFPLPPFI
jgi:hypothetical protein